MNALVIGCGSIGRRHLNNLASGGVSSLAAMDVSPQAVEAVKKEMGIPVFTSLEQALAEFKPQIAFITNPPHLHVEASLQCAKAGCHLFIEKPLSSASTGLSDLVGILKEKNLVSMVGCNLRFHPNVQFIRSFIQEGKLGRLFSVQAEMGAYLPDWRPGADYRKNYAAKRDTGGGVLLDNIHEMDYLRWIAGEIETIQCLAGKASDLEIETEDIALINLKFSSGAFGQIYLDYFQRPYSRGSKWVGEKGTLVWRLTEKEVRFYPVDKEKWEVVHRLPDDFDLNQMYVDEIAHFLSEVKKGQAELAPVEDAETVLSLVLRCQREAGLVK